MHSAILKKFGNHRTQLNAVSPPLRCSASPMLQPPSVAACPWAFFSRISHHCVLKISLVAFVWLFGFVWTWISQSLWFCSIWLNLWRDFRIPPAASISSHITNKHWRGSRDSHTWPQHNDPNMLGITSYSFSEVNLAFMSSKNLISRTRLPHLDVLH